MLALLLASAPIWIPYWGGLAIICAIIGFFISGALGLILGFLFGPIGLLVALLIPRKPSW